MSQHSACVSLQRRRRALSHRVIRVLFLQLLCHVCHGFNGGLQVGREDQAEAVGVGEPLQLYRALTPKIKR